MTLIIDAEWEDRVCAKEPDPAALLVYADWLDEQGERGQEAYFWRWAGELGLWPQYAGETTDWEGVTRESWYWAVWDAPKKLTTHRPTHFQLPAGVFMRMLAPSTCGYVMLNGPYRCWAFAFYAYLHTPASEREYPS